jgi:Flp pilus assembly protein TadB
MQSEREYMKDTARGEDFPRAVAWFLAPFVVVAFFLVVYPPVVMWALAVAFFVAILVLFWRLIARELEQ